MAIDWLGTHREVIALTALMAVAAGLRLWALDAKALHHDESLHAQFTWYLFNGDGYRHDPLMHGPFLFHAGATVFFLFGDNDFTARLLPALFGTALVGMPYFLRRQIGMKAVFVAAVLLTFSPTLLYFSRFDRNDIYLAVWTFAIVICIWRYLDERRPRYLYVMAALLALSFATKEVTFITVALMLLFLNFMLALELGRRRIDETVSVAIVFARTLVLSPFAWLTAAAWPVLGRRPFGRERLPAVGDVIIVLGTLTLPQFGAAIQELPFVDNDGYMADSEATLRVTTVIVLVIMCAYVGLLWRPKVWLIAAAFFFIPFVLLFTTFLTNQPAFWTGDFWRGTGGFWTGIWGSLDYWLDQQDVRRGNQPSYYYGLLTPLYEFLPLLLALGGAAWLALRGDALRRWLLFWPAGIFVGLSLAGEKMPWLEVHIALPLALAGGVALAAAMDRFELSGRRWLTAAGLAGISAAAVLLLVEGGSSRTLELAGWAIGAALVVWTLVALIRGGFNGFARSALAVLVAALLTLTVRAAVTVSFVNDDTPVDLLVYTQTAPDIVALRDRIDVLAQKSGLGENLPIVIDPTDGFAWPWAWYLRDYNEFSYTNPAEPNYSPPDGAVLLVNRSNAANIDITGYSQTPFKHRWWFLESYRGANYSGMSLSELASVLTTPDSLRSLGRFFLHRRPAATNTGSVDAVAFFPESLAAFDVRREPPLPPPEPAVLEDGRIVFGRGGSQPGEFNLPAGLFIDGEGDIWVADARNHRVQKFNAAGDFLEVLVGSPAVGNFNEPWSIALDGEGNVYVADTWAHRIQKFSPQLEFIASWGEPSPQQNPDLLQLFGPRDIVIAADGTLWLTDTGNKRLIHYSPDGEPLGSLGGPGSADGRFNEPVGLAYDALGRLYVADAWNARIQRFEADFSAPVSFPTGWSSREVMAKPYLAVLGDGRIVASDPGNGLLLLLDAEGESSGLWRPEADSQPIGVAALADGGFVFSDGRRNELQVVPGDLVSELFR